MSFFFTDSFAANKETITDIEHVRSDLQKVFDLFEECGFDPVQETPQFFNLHLRKGLPFCRFEFPLRLPDTRRAAFNRFVPPKTPCFAPLTPFPEVALLAGEHPAWRYDIKYNAPAHRTRSANRVSRVDFGPVAKFKTRPPLYIDDDSAEVFPAKEAVANRGQQSATEASFQATASNAATTATASGAAETAFS